MSLALCSCEWAIFLLQSAYGLSRKVASFICTPFLQRGGSWNSFEVKGRREVRKDGAEGGEVVQGGGRVCMFRERGGGDPWCSGAALEADKQNG